MLIRAMITSITGTRKLPISRFLPTPAALANPSHRLRPVQGQPMSRGHLDSPRDRDPYSAPRGRGSSSVGRARRSQCRGQGFDPPLLHHPPRRGRRSKGKRLIMSRRALAAVFVLIVAAAPAQAAEVYQVSTISSLLAGGYDGTVTVGELLRHGNLGLGTYNGVDGEMVVLAGRAYRCSVDAVAHPVKAATRTPFAVVTDFHPQTTVAVPAGQSLTRLQATLDALPASESRIVAVRIVGHFQGMQVRSEPKQSPPYRPLADVIKTQQV